MAAALVRSCVQRRAMKTNVSLADEYSAGPQDDMIIAGEDIDGE